MALKLPKIFPEKGAADTDLGIPTTQVKMSPNATATYDPLASVSIMDQLRSAGGPPGKTSKIPVIGHLPVFKQFQVLGVLLVTFLVFAVFIVFIDNRTAAQRATSSATATDMQ